jgi:tetratricopeptide (TPR) repeat protein
MSAQQSFDLALQHHRAGRLAEAEALYRQVLAAEPQHAGALHYRGVIAHQCGRHDLAVEWIGRAIALEPHSAAAHSNFGEACRALGRLDDAETAFRRAIELEASNASAHCNLGTLQRTRGEREEAAASYRRAIEIQPALAAAHYNLGTVLAELDRPEEAIAAFQRALQLEPNSADIHHRLGNAFAALDRFDDAAAAYRQALALKPDFAEAHTHLATMLRYLRHFDEAETEYHRALTLKPDLADAAFGLALQRLLLGDYASGWAPYEARWAVFQAAKRDFGQPLWDGTPLHGRRLLIHAEQGRGDAIQFIRYASLAAERGGKIVVECQASLVELLRTAKGVDEVAAAGDALPAFDVHIPMLSLPRIFQTTRENIPAQVPYLSVPADRPATDHGPFRVGLAWAGSPHNRHHRLRDIPLRALLPLLEVDGVEFVSLQVGDAAAQLREISDAAPITEASSHLRDFADTAALVNELDLVISVDTAVAHLAGALARPVWTLVPFVPDWRWGFEGGTTPWYPTMRLFRQPALGDWGSVVADVARELEQIE